MTYSEKLRSPKWQKKRLEIMQRDGWKCISCGIGTVTLNVHHKEYKFGKEPWEYEDENFETLCERCHIEKHMPDSNDPKAISEVMEITKGGYIDLQRKAFRETLKVRTDLTSFDLLKKGLSGYLMHITSVEEQQLVNAYCLSTLKFICENYFVIIAKTRHNHKLIESDKTKFFDYMNEFFNGNISYAIVAEYESL